jgi:hypothetical protein
MEYKYTQEAPEVLNQVVDSIKNEVESYGNTHSLSDADITSKAFRFARSTLPKIRDALKDHFKGETYDLLIKTTMDRVLTQKKRRMVYAPDEFELRKEFATILHRTQAELKKSQEQSGKQSGSTTAPPSKCQRNWRQRIMQPKWLNKGVEPQPQKKHETDSTSHSKNDQRLQTSYGDRCSKNCHHAPSSVTITLRSLWCCCRA